jgi:uncharacterized repeat protein (TIGR03803 family)
MRDGFRGWTAGLAAIAVCAAVTFAGGASAYTMKTLYSFCSQAQCADGLTPSMLTMDSSGNLYGSASAGGGDGRGRGVIFELAPNADKSAWTYTVLYRFCAGCGARPEGKLVLDTAGNLYGATELGGHKQGTIFELSPNAGRTSWTLTRLHAFCKESRCPDGQRQINALAYAGAATGALYDGTSPLYGTTSDGGGGSGVVFRLAPKDGQFHFQVIYEFCPTETCDGGGKPYSPVYVDPQGNLFVTTTAGGQHNQGGIIELSPRPHGKFAATALYNFCSPIGSCTDGNYARSDLIPDAQGTLYGTTLWGGYGNQGTIYKLVPDGQASQQSVLYSFCTHETCDDGRWPSAGPLTMDTAGNLFGATEWGGIHHDSPVTSGGGTVFEFNNGIRQTLYDFCATADCSDGQYPTGGLVLDAQGNLFGTTSYGGLITNRESLGAGTIFELTP